MNVHNVEQNTPEWLALRAGIPTASEFKKIITSQGEPSKQMKDYAALLAAERFAGGQLERWEGNQWTERGHALEAEARATYGLQDVTLESVGFVTNHEAGCSPDCLVNDDGLLEIKCLSPQQHVLTLDYYAKHRRPQPNYVPQVHGQMLICERDWCDLYFFHPELPELTIRVNRDQAFCDALTGQISAVLDERDRFLKVLEEQVSGEQG